MLILPLFINVGTEGEYYWKPLDTSISHDSNNINDDDNKEEHKGYGFMALPNNGITNYVDISQQRSGSMLFLKGKTINR